MKRLSKAQETRHAELSAKLTATFEEMTTAVDEFNDEITRLYEDNLKPKVEAYNAAVADANEFIQEVHGEQEDYHSEKSERWQEGDAGSAYADWMAEWEIELEDVELEEAPQLDEPDPSHEEFENLPTEVSS